MNFAIPGGQTLNDRVTAARHSLAGHGLAKSVCKATTEELMGPKKKHIDYLIQCTNEPNVSIPQLANLLIERTQNPSWIIVFKSLVSIHNIMNYGNERFTQYLASNNCSLNLESFLDKAAVQGYDMSTFVRRYAKYINEKSYSYRQMAFDFCKVKRGKEDGLLRTMNTDKLLGSLPVLQNQLDALLEFDCSSSDLSNGIINASFMLLFKDLIRLFACYNDGIINLLEKYFEMNKKQCRDALDLYKKFLTRMDKVSEFLKVAESVGIDKGDIPDLAKAPSSLLEALEAHLAQLEGKEKPPTKASSPSKAVNVAAAITNLNSPVANISEAEKSKILEEENKILESLREKHANELASTNPFAKVETKSNAEDLVAFSGPNPFSDMINSDVYAQPAEQNLNNPFFNAGEASTTPNNQQSPWPSASGADFGTFPTSTDFPTVGSQFSPLPSQNDLVGQGKMMSNQMQNLSMGYSRPPLTGPAASIPIGAVAPQAGPSNLVPSSFSSGYSCPVTANGHNNSCNNLPGSLYNPNVPLPYAVMQPLNQPSKDEGKLIQGDLESSLMSLAGNLKIAAPSVKKQDHQWVSVEKKMTGPKTGGPQTPFSPTFQTSVTNGQQPINDPFGDL